MLCVSPCPRMLLKCDCSMASVAACCPAFILLQGVNCTSTLSGLARQHSLLAVTLFTAAHALHNQGPFHTAQSEADKCKAQLQQCAVCRMGKPPQVLNANQLCTTGPSQNRHHTLLANVMPLNPRPFLQHSQQKRRACIHKPNPLTLSHGANPAPYHMVKPAGMPLELMPMELPAPAPPAFFSFFSTMIACACNAHIQLAHTMQACQDTVTELMRRAQLAKNTILPSCCNLSCRSAHCAPYEQRVFIYYAAELPKMAMSLAHVASSYLSAHPDSYLAPGHAARSCMP